MIKVAPWPMRSSAGPALFRPDLGARRLTLDLADGANCRLDPLGIGGPERGEFRHVHIIELLAEIRERRFELLAVRRRVQDLAQKGDDVLRRSLGRKQSDPEIIFDVVP